MGNMAYFCEEQNITAMELSELSKKRLEGVDERLKAIVMECAKRCPFPFNVSEGLRTVEKQREYYHKVNMEKKYGANRIAGEEFLAKNAKADSIQTTASGLQYKILTKGTGEIPQATDKVTVNYEGHLIDGTEFDSSYSRKKPATFPVNQVIKGWTEALTMMPVGSKWMLYIPQELAYGDREQNKIPPFSTLIFTVELLEIVK